MREWTTGLSAPERVSRVGWVGLLINLLLAAAKAVAGILGHSQAVFADALHSLTDSVFEKQMTIT